MKNMKPLIMLVAIVFASSTAFAQIEISLGTGFLNGAFQSTSDGFDMGNPMGKKVTGDAAEPDVENIYYSLGGGVPINLGIGIPISDHITFNADFAYVMGNKQSISEVDVSADLGPSGTLTLTGTGTAQSTQIRFNPGLTFSSDMGLYARTGLVIPLGGKTVINLESESTGPFGDVTSSEERETGGSFTIGAQTAVGYAVELADNMKLGFELVAIALNIQSATSEITAYEDNQDGTLDSEYPDTYDREVNYVDMLDASSNNADFNDDYDTSKPMDDFANRQSFGAWGINVNFIYVIGG